MVNKISRGRLPGALPRRRECHLAQGGMGTVKDAKLRPGQASTNGDGNRGNHVRSVRAGGDGAGNMPVFSETNLHKSITMWHQVGL